MPRTVQIQNVRVGGRNPLALIAGPCVIESRAGCLAIAKRLARLAREEQIPLVFKASYDKANRTSSCSYRGPGLQRGLEILAEVKETVGLPVLTDVHSPAEVPPAARVADVLQIPAFLCRQTDLLTAAGESGKPVNIKKGQFLAPEDMAYAVAKVERAGNRRILLTERGTTFGYHRLVVDMSGLPVMRSFGYPVVFDATHSVQIPGGAGDRSGGERRHVPYLARAAVAAGCDAVFVETHPHPAAALSDRDSVLSLARVRGLWRMLRAIDRVVRGAGGG